MSWKNIVGHEPVLRLLKGQVSKDRVPSTYLFAGPSGIGKRALALELAKALQCAEPTTDGSCDGCEACLKIMQGTFPDVMEIRPDGETDTLKIEHVRTLANGMALTSYAGKWKVGIVDGADRLTEEAAHACLKILEEPTEKSLLILIATAPYRLPSTLVSRCHLVRCAPQGIQRAAAYLTEKEKLDAGQAALLATSAGGRLGLALEFHRNDRLASRNKNLNQLLNAWHQRSLELPLGTAPRPEIEEALEWLASWWRDQLVVLLKGDAQWLIHQDRLQELEKIRAVSEDDLADLVEMTFTAQEAIQRNASPRIALSALLSRSADGPRG